MGKKKGVHTIHEVHPHTIRNRERERVKAAKHAARYFKWCRKQARSRAVSSPGDATDIPEPLHYVTSSEETEVQEKTDLPLPSSQQPGTLLAQGQGLSHQINSSKDNKETRFDRASVQEKSPTATQSEDRKIQKKIAEKKQRGNNISLTGQSSSQSIPLNYSDVEKRNKDQQSERQLGARSKTKFVVKAKEPPTPKTLTTHTSVLEKSLKATKPAVPITQKKAAGINRLESNFSGTGQASSQSIPPNRSDDLRLQRDETRTQQGSRLVPVTSRKVAEEPENAVLGFIVPYAINERDGNKDRTIEIISIINSNVKRLKIEDEYISIYMLIYESGQVICNLREHLLGDSDVNDEVLCPRTMEDQAIIKSEKDVLSDPEHHDKTPTDSSNLSEVNRISKENNSSGLNSVQENIEELCSNFLKDCTTECESLEARFINNIKKEKLS